MIPHVHQGTAALKRLLEAAEAAPPVDAVSAVTREVGARLGATSVSFLIADLSGRALVRLAHVPVADDQQQRVAVAVVPGERAEGEDTATLVPLDGGPIEGVIRAQKVVVVESDVATGPARWKVLAPVTERGESIGVLEVCLPRPPSQDECDEIAFLGHLLAFVVIANRRHTDLFEWGQRSRQLSLSAEIQQRLLPGPHTCEAGPFTLSGWLEPASDIAGDTFDYTLARDALHLSLTDAMGHGVNAALTATLCVGELRGARRRGMSLVDQTASANAAVAEHGTASGLEDFVTGLVGRLDLRSAVLHLVNAGHVAPYLCRGTDVRSVDLPVNLPLGMFADASYEATALALEPGDRVVFVTDGMLERNAEAIDLPAAIGRTRALHPREAVAALADDVLAATGHALTDDATVLCLDWYGGHGRDRTSDAGADPDLASHPER